MNDVVRQTFENKTEFKEFISQSKDRLKDLTDPNSVPQLAGIGSNLTSILSGFYSDTEVVASILPIEDMPIQYPSATLSIKHRDIAVDVENVGHGLQRAMLFSIVRFLTGRDLEEEKGEEFTSPQSDIIIIIEEPEIYQHPLKQSTFYGAFKAITESFNRHTGIRVQIIFTTHSEKFVHMADIAHVRRISKRKCEDGHFSTDCNSLSLTDFSAGMAGLLQSPNPKSEIAFAAGLHIFTREVSEGFFADTVLIVEGVSDAEMIRAYFEIRRPDLDLSGLSVISVGGKSKLDKPFFAFDKMGIPAFVLWDNDFSEKGNDRAQTIKRNRRLMRMIGEEEDDFPSGVFERGAAFRGHIESYLQSEVGLVKYTEIMNRHCTGFDITSKEACKSPVVARAIINEIAAGDAELSMLDEIAISIGKLLHA
ncbi:ATP-dependent nuclease [Notoacmeibacter ruber]|uniref:ATP-dependent nuclease n=1 Tax=Notoacmeibacter ruber TaxID=2670375 RepID=UPI001314154D|nr:AAA family ATPase [Notoacmeibacter ruber]